MDLRVIELERQNKLLKLIACSLVLLVAIGFSMGAASFNQDRGELLNITKIQLVDDQGHEVAIIDAKGVDYRSKNSQVIANKIIGRRSVAANSNPDKIDKNERYAELGVTSDRTCYMELGNKGAVYHAILSESGILENNF